MQNCNAGLGICFQNISMMLRAYMENEIGEEGFIRNSL